MSRLNQRDYKITLGKQRAGEQVRFEVLRYKKTHRCHAVRNAESEAKAFAARTGEHCWIEDVEEV